MGPYVPADRSDVGYRLGDHLSTLHFGFDRVYYPDGRMTTTDVANILEDEYHIVEHFRDFHKVRIEEILHQALVDQMDTGAVKADLHKIEDLFKEFLNSRDIERLGIPGVPSRVSRRTIKVGGYMRKGSPVRGYRRLGGSLRPSFIHSGLYRDSFRAWLEKD